VTAGSSSTSEVQQLLRVLAAGRRCAEAGTAFGEGAAALAETAMSVLTTETDPERAAIARQRLAELPHVELVVGDWRQVLPPRGPFDLFFADGGGWKKQPFQDGPLMLELLAPNGLLVVDDMTSDFPRPDRVRDFLFGEPRLIATEIVIAPGVAAIVAVRRS
jgi:predicted O-methyltransferase YrrM